MPIGLAPSAHATRHASPLAPPLAMRSIAGEGWEGVAVGCWKHVASTHPSPTLPCEQGREVALASPPVGALQRNQGRFMERSLFRSRWNCTRTMDRGDGWRSANVYATHAVLARSVHSLRSHPPSPPSQAKGGSSGWRQIRVRCGTGTRDGSWRGAKRRSNPKIFGITKNWIASLRSQRRWRQLFRVSQECKGARRLWDPTPTSALCALASIRFPFAFLASFADPALLSPPPPVGPAGFGSQALQKVRAGKRAGPGFPGPACCKTTLASPT